MRLIGMVAVIAVLGAAGIAVAQDAKAVYDKRVASMRSNGQQMQAINRFLRGEAEFGPAVVTAAEQLDANAKDYASLFTAGSNVAGSRAKPEIWTNAADFQMKIAAYQAATANLAAAAKGGDKTAIQAAFGPVGGQCGACHQGYQAPR